MTGRVRWGATDSLTLARRNLLMWAKVPAFIVFTVVQPVMFTLLFRYVFGGAINTAAPGGYIDFLHPRRDRPDGGVRLVRARRSRSPRRSRRG